MDNALSGSPVAKRKLVHIEVLRILAIYTVMMVHTANHGFFLFCDVGDQSPFYYLYMSFSIICKSLASPLFFMISGALLLGKDEPIRVVYKKRIFRIFIVLFIVSLLYNLYDCFMNGTSFSPLAFLERFYSEDCSLALWFLYAYLALLTMLPLLRRMARNMTTQEYWYLAGMSLLCVGVIPILQYRFSLGEVKINYFLRGALFTSTSIVYFMMGYFFEHVLDKKYFTWKNASLGILLSIICVGISCYMTQFQIGASGICTEEETQMFHTSLIAVMSYTAYFTGKLFLMDKQISQRTKKMVCTVGAATYGIYLMERFLREQTIIVYDTLDPVMNSLLACFIWILVAFSIGFVITYLLKKIPLVSRYI